MSQETEDGGIIIITSNEDEFLDVTDGEVVSLSTEYEPFKTEDDEEVVVVRPSSETTHCDTDLKRRRSTYSVSKKLEILRKYETIYKRNARRTERETGVPRKCIQRWLQQRDKIEELAKSYYDEYGNEVRSYTVRESRAVFPELEAELASYVVQRNGVTRSEVSRLAMDIFPTVYPTKDPSCFKASKHWFNNFMQRLKEGMDYVPKSKAREELEEMTRAQLTSNDKLDTCEYSRDNEYGIETISPASADVVAKNFNKGVTLPLPETDTCKDDSVHDDATSRRCRSTYSLPFKHSVIQKFHNEYGQSITRTSKALDIPRKCIHRWVQQQEKIEALLQVNSKPAAETPGEDVKAGMLTNDTLLSAGATCYVKEKNLTKLGNHSVMADLDQETNKEPKEEISSLAGRKVRAIYSLELKNETIEKYDKLYNCSIRRTARETGIPRKCVQRWVRQREKIRNLVNIESGNRTCKVKVCYPRKRALKTKAEEFSELDTTEAGLRKRRRYFEERMLPIPPELKKIPSQSPERDEEKVYIVEMHSADSDLSDNSRSQPCAKADVDVTTETFSSSSNDQYVKSEFNMEHDDNGETIITVLPSDLVETPTNNASTPGINPSGRRNRSSYSLSTKLSALDNYFNVYGQNCRKTAREMGIPRKCVQRWVQQRDKIQEWSQVHEHSVLKKLFTFRGRKPEYPELEKELMVMLRNMNEIGVTLTVKQLGEKAKSLFRTFYPDRNPDAFKASNHWVRNFLKRAQEGPVDSDDMVEHTDAQEEPLVDSAESNDARSDMFPESGDANIVEVEVVDGQECGDIYALSMNSEGDDASDEDFGGHDARSGGDASGEECTGEEESLPSMIPMAHVIHLQ